VLKKLIKRLFAKKATPAAYKSPALKSAGKPLSLNPPKVFYGVSIGFISHAKTAFTVRNFRQSTLQKTFGHEFFKLEAVRSPTSWFAEEYLYLCAAASFNRSGYVREAALIGLASYRNPIALRCILIRLTDWLYPIHLKAKQHIDTYRLEPSSMSRLAQNIDVLTSLASASRHDSRQWVFQLVNQIYQNQADWKQEFHDWSEPAKYQVIKNWPAAVIIEDEFLNQIVTQEPSDNVRRRLLENALLVEQITQRTWALLAADKSPKIRLAALRHFASTEQLSEEQMRAALCSNFGAMRGFAQFIAQKRGFDLTSFYEFQLEVNSNCTGALLGLSDIGSNNHTLIEPFLFSDKPKVQRAAFKCLNQSTTYDLEPFALQALQSQNLKLRRDAIHYFVKSRSAACFKEISQMIFSADTHLKKLLLSALTRAGGLQVLPVIIRMTLDADDVIRVFACKCLTQWKRDRVNNFTTADEALKQAVLKVWTQCLAAHVSIKHFKQNPLTHLDKLIY
jgi:hypothetical protein